MTSGNAGASPAWPGVTTKASGRQRLLAARWILVVKPRGNVRGHGRPARRLGPLLTGPGGVLVGANDGGVDRDDPVEVAFGVGLGEQSGEDLLPGAVGGPRPQPVVGTLPRPKVLGQVHPGCPGAVLERDRVDHLPVITPPSSPLRCPVRQQRLDPHPLGISQRHTSTNDQMIRRKRPSRPSLGRACSRHQQMSAHPWARNASWMSSRTSQRIRRGGTSADGRTRAPRPTVGRPARSRARCRGGRSVASHRG